MPKAAIPTVEIAPLNPFAHLPLVKRARHEAESEVAYITDGIAHAAAIDAAKARQVHCGYVRVSTDRQDSGSDAQRRAFEGAGCTTIIEEQASGRKARPALGTLVVQLALEDILTVYRFDRSVAEHFVILIPIGRAMMGFAAIWAELGSRHNSRARQQRSACRLRTWACS